MPTLASSQEGYLISRDADWRYHADEKSPAKNWNELEFAAQDWPQGKASFGYGDDDDKTVLKKMEGNFPRVQIRANFEIADLENLERLYLYMNFDDAFVAYINGVEVARSTVEEKDGEHEVGLHEAEGFEEFVVEFALKAKKLLKVGKNVLAVEGFNQSLESSDFSLHPVLSRERKPNINISLSRELAIADINELERRVKDQSSYVRRDKFDYEKAFEDARNSIKGELSVFELNERLQQIIARIGDCHAGIYAPFYDPRSRFLPFSLADSRDGVIAMKIDRSSLIDEKHPYVSAIDGKPLDDWLATAAKFVADGSPQFIRNRSLYRMREINLIRRYLNIPASMEATITLRSKDGSKTSEQTVKLALRPSPTGSVPIARTRLLDGNIGYLRIEEMDNRLMRTIARKMNEFKETDGLIIDVRDNGGGRYGLLHLMYGFLTPADSKPYITNIAAFRKSELFEEDHLNYRPTFRENYEDWNEEQKAAIKTAREKFKPEWTPPTKLFSDWHYMVIDKTPGIGQYYYDKPVVVLCNSGSFSATDGFLSGMTDIPGVTLLGEPSGGGSGSTRRFVLPESKLYVGLSSMASFRANGKLFDGNGVEVDIEMKPTISDFLGDSDTVRSKAIQLIQAKNSKKKKDS
jgi:hypothetical protein